MKGSTKPSDPTIGPDHRLRPGRHAQSRRDAGVGPQRVSITETSQAGDLIAVVEAQPLLQLTSPGADPLDARPHPCPTIL